MSLWKSSSTKSPSTRIYKHKNKGKEASFCTCHKASLTVEATVVIPVLAGFFVTILFFFRVLQVQVAVEEALMYAGRKVAVESSVAESETVQFASAEALVLYALKDEMVIEQYVQNGSFGIVLLASEFEESKIVLQANYRVKLPISMFGINSISLWSRNIVRKWVGDLPSGDTKEETWVYTTPEGEVYHAVASCRAIKLNIKKASVKVMETLRGANGQKYYPCARCANESSNVDMVYYTDYGTLYHGRVDCAYIKRTVNKQKLSEVEDRRPCSYCY